MIQPLSSIQYTKTTATKATEASKVDFEQYLSGFQEEIIIDERGNEWKYGYRVDNAIFKDYYTEEQLERWHNSLEKVDAVHSAFLTLMGDSLDRNNMPGMMSMNFYDFCYLLEQGEVVNPQQTGQTATIMQSREWDYSLFLTETFGVRNVQQNKQSIEVVRYAMDLGMVSMERGLMLPSDVEVLHAKQKARDQQLLLERVFESKHLTDAKLNTEATTNIFDTLKNEVDIRNATFDEVKVISQKLYEAGKITGGQLALLTFDYDRAMANISRAAGYAKPQASGYLTPTDTFGKRDWIAEWTARALHDKKTGYWLGHITKTKLVDILQMLDRRA